MIFTDSDKVAAAIEKIPTTVEDFISSSRGGGDSIMETYNILYKDVHAKLAGMNNPLGKSVKAARFIKATLRQACANAAFADYHYPKLESANGFVAIIGAFKTVAKNNGLNTDIFDKWLGSRDEQTYNPADLTVDSEDESMDLDSLMADMKVSTDATVEAPTPAATTA